MPKPKKKASVTPELAREWLSKVEDKGETPPEIADNAGYDVRTVRKQIEKARLERERREARFAVYRNALEEHYKDLIYITDEIKEELSNHSISSSLKGKKLFKALRQHIPRSSLWRAINKLDGLNDEINSLQDNIRERLRETVQADTARIKGAEIFPDSIAGAAVLRQIIEKEELPSSLITEPVTEGKTRIQYRSWSCAVVPNEQISQGEKLVLSLMMQANELPESAEIGKQLSQRNQIVEDIREELATIKLRKIVPGRCKYCPI